ncbi:MAG: rhamnulokinase [Eubacteriales bacterium]|nr:rhamnulokinase [Eubacteriales bacterium]
MSTYYLAVDIGASSGRHILGHLEDGMLKLEEIHRFENGMKRTPDGLCWDIPALFDEIRTGIKKCRELGKIPVSMGIDTWAVDYVLLDEQDQILGASYGYRDSRTEGMDQIVYGKIPEAELYGRTGIQKQIFNTIFQLEAVQQSHPEYLKKAKTFLMLPDYFHFLLTGVKRSEYTNATSTQLVHAVANDWDRELIGRLGLDGRMFLPLSQPGTTVGEFTEEIAREAGFSCRVVLPATHDTASAVMAVPCGGEDCLYISSGTWSLMGTENRAAICTEESRQRNFTNEGGYEYRYRYLKNIMGLWMIQSVRHELNDAYSFAELCEMADQCRDFPSRVNANDPAFLAPENMIGAVKEACRRTGQPVPETPGQLATVIYQSLADCYAETAEELEGLTGSHYKTIHIVGGGSNAGYLNRLTAERSGRRVLAGPAEATAIGNLLAQMIGAGEFSGLSEARACVARSFDLKTYEGGR